MKITTWNGCYSNQWRGLIVPEAFSHPAKYSPGLIQRIYQHGIEQGYFKPGDVIGDCFGGIGGGGIFAAYAGLRWIGVELEQKFVDLANQNFDLHRPTWKAHGYPEPVIIQGDSRRFAEIVGECAAICTSPPFEESIPHQDANFTRRLDGTRIAGAGLSYGTTPGQIGRLKAGEISAVITSPPFIEMLHQTEGGMLAPHQRADNGRNENSASVTARSYGHTPGQIGAMKAGKLDSVITSPPYAETALKNDLTQEQFDKKLERWATVSNWKRPRPTGNMSQPDYGTTPGQIGAMRAGKLAAVITSPPYAEARIAGQGDEGTSGLRNEDGSFIRGSDGWLKRKELGNKYGDNPQNIGNLRSGGLDAITTSPPFSEPGCQPVGKCPSKPVRSKLKAMGIDDKTEYGWSDGQIGNEKSESYWEACRTVYEQCWLALKPGGYLICVVKSYVKNKRRVPLPQQTLKLLIHLGFEPIERIKAMLTQSTVQGGLFGEDIVKEKARKSFFRRLAEKNGSPRIDWEEVLICRKP